jgi:hypothetical protein
MNQLVGLVLRSNSPFLNLAETPVGSECGLFHLYLVARPILNGTQWLFVVIVMSHFGLSGPLEEYANSGMTVDW